LYPYNAIKYIKMAIKSVNFLKTQNRDWDNVYDSFLSIAPKDNNTVQTLKGIKREVIAVNSTPFNAQVSSSGAIYVVSHSSAVTFSLPATGDSAGVFFTLAGRDTNAHIISQSSGDSAAGKQGALFGIINHVSGGADANTANSGSINIFGKSKITFAGAGDGTADDQEGSGDHYRFECDGTNWYVTANVSNPPALAAK